jgi:mycofactocin precursor
VNNQRNAKAAVDPDESAEVLFGDQVVIDEVTIDGMCGVY